MAVGMAVALLAAVVLILGQHTYLHHIYCNLCHAPHCCSHPIGPQAASSPNTALHGLHSVIADLISSSSVMQHVAIAVMYMLEACGSSNTQQRLCKWQRRAFPTARHTC